MARYGNSYFVEVQHPGLGKWRQIKGSDPVQLERMSQQQLLVWDQQWARVQERERRKQATEILRLNRYAQKDYVRSREEEAADLCAEAAAAIAATESLLSATLAVDDRVNWGSLKQTDDFATARPKEPHTSDPRPRPDEPDRGHYSFKAEIRLVDRLIPGRTARREEEANARYARAKDAWERAVAELDRQDAADQATRQTWVASVAEWQSLKAAFEAERDRFNSEIDRRREAYLAGDPAVIFDYCGLVLHRSVYPDFIPRSSELDYDEQTKTLIVEMQLPAPEDLPDVAEHRYNRRADEITSKPIPAAKAAALYDSAVHQMVLRTLHELFEADTINALDAIILNGWVDRIDKATGQRGNVVVLSVQAGKEEFSRINLAAVDPKACFRALKGVGAARMGSLTPVAPIAAISRDDRRFVEARTVEVEEGTNLASVDWEEFEHLVRQILEKEFASEGSEVRVTQASRDGGVDAIVFDSDPLRGGKIVVQAKRYTNTVGVSAVRDLFGTVQHEGATKGILVTTAGFGPDAYAFAKGKPLTLLDGPHLLFLLQRHGYKARIDLGEARRTMKAASG